MPFVFYDEHCTIWKKLIYWKLILPVVTMPYSIYISDWMWKNIHTKVFFPPTQYIINTDLLLEMNITLFLILSRWFIISIQILAINVKYQKSQRKYRNIFKAPKLCWNDTTVWLYLIVTYPTLDLEYTISRPHSKTPDF